jgi:hypothetical protein
MLCAILASACSSSCKSVSFALFEKADRVVIKADSNPVSRITDPVVISKIVAFALAHEQGWKAPVPDTPIGGLKLEFYSGDQFLGHIGIGRAFLETQGCDYFVSRPLTENDLRLVLGILGVSGDLTK